MVFCFNSSHSSNMALSQSVRGSYTSAYVLLLLLSNRTIWTNDSRLTAKSDSVKIKWWKKECNNDFGGFSLTHAHMSRTRNYQMEWAEKNASEQKKKNTRRSLLFVCSLFRSLCLVVAMCELRKNTAHIYIFYLHTRQSTRGPFSRCSLLLSSVNF